MNTVFRLLCAGGAVSAAFLAHAASPAADAPAATPPMLQAAASYRRGELGTAFVQFSALANKGQHDAARVALFMHVHGPALYGRYWGASPEELRRWRELVVAGPVVPVRALDSVAARRAP